MTKRKAAKRQHRSMIVKLAMALFRARGRSKKRKAKQSYGFGAMQRNPTRGHKSLSPHRKSLVTLKREHYW